MCIVGYSKPTLEPPDDPKLPKTVVDLMEEMKKIGLTLPESIYTVFQKAVKAHLDGELEEAQGYYERLKIIPRASGGSYGGGQWWEIPNNGCRFFY